MKKTYVAPEVELLGFSSQDALTSSDITGFAGVNWADGTGWTQN